MTRREQARKLAKRLRGLLCHVNAIPLNPTTGYAGKQPTTRGASARGVQGELERLGIPCTVRLRRGIDIAAGCGQLGWCEYLVWIVLVLGVNGYTHDSHYHTIPDLSTLACQISACIILRHPQYENEHSQHEHEPEAKLPGWTAPSIRRCPP